MESSNFKYLCGRNFSHRDCTANAETLSQCEVNIDINGECEVLGFVKEYRITAFKAIQVKVFAETVLGKSSVTTYPQFIGECIYY